MITKTNPETVVHEGQNYKATDEWLHSKLFAEKSEGLRLVWEYTNMMFVSITPEETRKDLLEKELRLLN